MFNIKAFAMQDMSKHSSAARWMTTTDHTDPYITHVNQKEDTHPLPLTLPCPHTCCYEVLISQTLHHFVLDSEPGQPDSISIIRKILFCVA